MAIQFVGGAVMRGLLAQSLRDDAVQDVVNSVDLRVGLDPKNPASIIEKIRGKIKRNKTKALSVTAQQGINIILDRTAKGYSWTGQSFKPYTPQYAAFRSERGHSTSPNLYFNGNMLGSMTHEVRRDEAIIFFARAEEAAKASGNNRSRPFFNFNDQERRKLSQIFRRRLL
jgi:hypothetical protein